MTDNTLTSSSTWSKIWHIVLFVAIPLVIGGLSAMLTTQAMTSFTQMQQPPLAPPAWLFPVAWTVLYVLMGLASYFIYSSRTYTKSDQAAKRNWLILYGLSLFFNFCWSPIFFNLQWYWFALFWLLILWVILIVLVVKARKISLPAMWMMLPYLIWVTFAAYLNTGIALLN